MPMPGLSRGTPHVCIIIAEIRLTQVSTCTDINHAGVPGCEAGNTTVLHMLNSTVYLGTRWRSKVVFCLVKSACLATTYAYKELS